MSETVDNCNHEWEVAIDSQWHSENFLAVSCAKCGVPGEQTIETGEVYYPTT